MSHDVVRSSFFYECLSVLSPLFEDFFSHSMCMSGFSRTTVDLLKSVDAEFSTFNILADDEVSITSLLPFVMYSLT